MLGYKAKYLNCLIQYQIEGAISYNKSEESEFRKQGLVATAIVTLHHLGNILAICYRLGGFNEELPVVGFLTPICKTRNSKQEISNMKEDLKY